MDIYEPAEDSFLLQKNIKNYAIGRVLDLGTGSGVLAIEASKSKLVREIVAADINENAVLDLKLKLNQSNNKKIVVLHSDLFSKIEGKFDLIIFNPPYLPQDKINGKNVVDLALYGGKKGWELSEKFFKQVNNYLVNSGKILFLFSSLTNKNKINEIISKNLLSYQELDKKKLAFEELYVYLIEKSKLRKELESKGISNISFLDKGCRGEVYSGFLDLTLKKEFVKKNIKVAIKTVNSESKAITRIENEIEWLKKLNVKGIGPKFYFSGHDYLVEEFIDGEKILVWIEKSDNKNILCLLNKVLKQCFEMDLLKVNKLEMNNPHKHILVTAKNEPIQIDFERCKISESPRNVTQFLDFIFGLDLNGKIKFNKAKLIDLAKFYKESYSKDKFEQILNSLIQ